MHIQASFSNGWMQKLKDRNRFKICIFTVNGAIRGELPNLREKIEEYSLIDVWNADEYELF